MKKTVELAGFVAADAIWNVSERGGPVFPSIAFERSDSAKPDMMRFMMEPYEAAIASGLESLTENKEKAVRAVLVFNGYVTLPGGRTDALFLEMKTYGRRGLARWWSAPTRSLTMAVPYRDIEKPGGFAVYRTKVLSDEGGKAVASDLFEAFLRGVDRHREGAKVWNDHLDASQ